MSIFFVSFDDSKIYVYEYNSIWLIYGFSLFPAGVAGGSRLRLEVVRGRGARLTAFMNSREL